MNKGESDGGEESWKVTLNVNTWIIFSLEFQNGSKALYAMGNFVFKCLKMSNSSLKLLQIGPWCFLSMDPNIKCIQKTALIYHK